MNIPTKIPIWRNFTNWGITVVLGSLLWPFVNQLFRESPFKFGIDDEMLGFAFISMIASALCSLPALLVLSLTIYFLNKQKIQVTKHQWIQNAIHVGISILTFAVMGVIGDLNYENVDSEAIAIAITYTSIGIITWNVTYILYRRKSKEILFSEELLDEKIQ